MLDILRKEISTWRPQDFRLITKYVKDPVKFKSQAQKFSRILDAKNQLFPEIGISEFLHILKSGRSSPDQCPVCSSNIPFKGDGLGYPKYCSNQCRRKDNIPNSQKVIVDGVEYSSVNSASRILNLEQWEINLHLLDPSKPNYRYLGDHDQICKDKISKIHPKLLDREFLVSWKDSRKTIKELCDLLNIKTHSTIKQAFVYHGIPTIFSQVTRYTKDKLNDPSWFITEYKKGGSAFVARQIGCSETTVLRKAFEYKLPPKNGKSAIEYTFKEFLESFGETVVHGSKDILTPRREIDLYIPDRKFGIELDGLTFHGENSRYPKPRDHHYSHMLACRSQNILCMRFNDFETTYKLDLVKSMISAKLGKSEVVIHARKCNIVSVASANARRFFEENHISGFSSASTYLGLEYQGELVFCMSFGKPRFSKNHDWEIIRLASKQNTTVVGGANKCLSKFRSEHSGQTLMTYCDLRFSDGAIYRRLGMDFVKLTGPGYTYYKGKQSFSRHRFQKHSIAKLCTHYDPNLDELANATNNGFIRYWDCGNAVYQMTM